MILFRFSSLHAQSDSLEVLLPELSADDDDGVSELIEYYQNNPVRLNEAAYDELLDIPLLPQWAADSLVNWRVKNGPITKKRTLRKILGDDYYALLKDMLDTRPARALKRNLIQRQSYQVEEIPEIENGRYAGDAFYSYTRLVYEFDRRWSFAAIAQKDPGEESYTDHFNAAAEGRFKNVHVILGDFVFKWAAGLAMGGAYAKRKSLLPSYSLRSNGARARPHISSSENSAKRGLYLKWTAPLETHLHLFTARTSRDARLNRNTVTGFSSDGYHRSANEIAGKGAVIENLYGIGLTKRLQKTYLGMLWTYYDYNKTFSPYPPFINESQYLRQRFAFSGKRAGHLSFFYQTELNRIQLSGEAAKDRNGALAIQQTVLYRLERWQYGILYSHLDKDWQAPDGRMFDSSDDAPRGQSVLYMTTRYSPNKDLDLSAYALLDKKLWPGFFDPLPTTQSDKLLQADWDLQRARLSFRWRQKQSEDFADSETGPLRVANKANSWRIELNFPIAKNLLWRGRWEHVRLSGEREKGTVIFQDLRFDIWRGVSISGRLTLFNTDSYQSRIYEYEHDLPGSFANFPMYGNGYKFYLMTKLFTTYGIHIWLKWRYLARENEKRFQNNSFNLQRTLRAQLRWRF